MGNDTRAKTALATAAALVTIGIGVYFLSRGFGDVPVPQQGTAAPVAANPSGTPPAPVAETPVETRPDPNAAPAPTLVASTSSIPSSAVEIKVSAAGFSPNTFSVRSGAKVTVALVSDDRFAHVLQFQDPALSNFSIGVSRGQIRTVEFEAPKPGLYRFSCPLPGHQGQTGTMIVD